MGESSHRKNLKSVHFKRRIQPMKEINHEEKPCLFMAEYKGGPIKKRMEKVIHDTNNDELV